MWKPSCHTCILSSGNGFLPTTGSRATDSEMSAEAKCTLPTLPLPNCLRCELLLVPFKHCFQCKNKLILTSFFFPKTSLLIGYSLTDYFHLQNSSTLHKHLCGVVVSTPSYEAVGASLILAWRSQHAVCPLVHPLPRDSQLVNKWILRDSQGSYTVVTQMSHWPCVPG